MKSLYLFAALLLSAFLTAQQAQAAGSLNVVLESYKVVSSDNGKQELLAAGTAKPGDVIEYRAIYHNESAQPLHNIVATLPIPASGVDYLPDATAMRTAQASLDGKTFSPMPLKRMVTLANGKRAEQNVPMNEYRFLRWTLGDLPAGASKSVSARVRIADFTPVATAAR